jgi:ABC-type dipeptide/oligopeptide/nickel transport system permease subunit
MSAASFAGYNETISERCLAAEAEMILSIPFTHILILVLFSFIVGLFAGSRNPSTK